MQRFSTSPPQLQGFIQCQMCHPPPPVLFLYKGSSPPKITLSTGNARMRRSCTHPVKIISSCSVGTRALHPKNTPALRHSWTAWLEAVPALPGVCQDLVAWNRRQLTPPPIPSALMNNVGFVSAGQEVESAECHC